MLLLKQSVALINFQERKKCAEKEESSLEVSEKEETDSESPTVLRPLNMEDLRHAKNQVSMNTLFKVICSLCSNLHILMLFLFIFLILRVACI